jgi:hypothetical protein
VKPPRPAIRLGVDRPGPWWTKSLIEKLAFTRANLSGVRVIITIMRILVEELLYQAVMGLIPVLSCLALNVAASRGTGSRGTYPVLGNT